MARIEPLSVKRKLDNLTMLGIFQKLNETTPVN